MVFFRRDKNIKDVAYILFTKIVEQARHPYFYESLGVADSLDGRFDLIILHMSLVMNRLESEGDRKKTAQLTRNLQEVLFDNMDMSLREMGVGDMSVGKKVKIMAEACYGRLAAYGQAFHNRPDDLTSTLTRNIYRGETPVEAISTYLVAYVKNQITCLEAQTIEDILSGSLSFEGVA